MSTDEEKAAMASPRVPHLRLARNPETSQSVSMRVHPWLKASSQCSQSVHHARAGDGEGGAEGRDDSEQGGDAERKAQVPRRDLEGDEDAVRDRRDIK